MGVIVTGRFYNEIALEEWKEGRVKINELDKNLHDLRKYGLTFIAALLAANSILDYMKLNSLTKFSISIITILFITVLNLLDQYYQDMAKAVSKRSKVLEAMVLNTELDEMFSYQFEKGNMSDYIKLTYNGLIIIAVAVGMTVIVSSPNTTSTNVENLSFLMNTRPNLSDLSSVLIFILKLLLLYILFLAPIVIKKNVGGISELCNSIKECTKNKNTRSKLCDNIKKGIKFTGQFLTISLLAIYYTIISFSFYYILASLFSFEITLSILLLLAGSTGIFIIDASSEMIRKRRTNLDKLKELEKTPLVIYDNPNSLNKTQLDWIIDRLLCNSGDIVRITVINHSKDNVKFKKSTCICEITSDDGDYCYHINAEKNITVNFGENYSWLWDTGKDTETGILPKGVCRIRPCGWKIPIRRSICVCSAKKNS